MLWIDAFRLRRCRMFAFRFGVVIFTYNPNASLVGTLFSSSFLFVFASGSIKALIKRETTSNSTGLLNRQRNTRLEIRKGLHSHTKKNKHFKDFYLFSFQSAKRVFSSIKKKSENEKEFFLTRLAQRLATWGNESIATRSSSSLVVHMQRPIIFAHFPWKKTGVFFLPMTDSNSGSFCWCEFLSLAD